MHFRIFALTCLLVPALAVNLGLGIGAVNSIVLTEEGHPVRHLLRHTIAKVLGINRAYSNHTGRKLRLATKPEDDGDNKEAPAKITGGGKLTPFLKELQGIIPKASLELKAFIDAFIKDMEEYANKKDSEAKSVLDLLTGAHAAMNLPAGEGQTLHFSSPIDRTLLRRFDVLLKAVDKYDLSTTYTINIENQLNVPVQMLLSSPMYGHRYAWSKDIGKGGVVTAQFELAPIFDLYVVPYVGTVASEIQDVKENSGEAAEGAVMTLGRALALQPGFGGDIYDNKITFGTKAEVKYDATAVKKALGELEAAMKEVESKDLGKEDYPKFIDFKETNKTKEKKEEEKGDEKGDEKQKPEDQALIFREVVPEKLTDGRATLVLTNNEEGKIILNGQKMRDGNAKGTCYNDEELFWGCCYQPCKTFDGGARPYRCHFYTCAKDENDCTTQGNTKGEYGSGASAHGMCRAPGWEKVNTNLDDEMKENKDKS